MRISRFLVIPFLQNCFFAAMHALDIALRCKLQLVKLHFFAQIDFSLILFCLN